MTGIPFQNNVIDISHYTDVVSWDEIRGSGICAVIQKATEGMGPLDKTYEHRYGPAKAAGLLWGSYHFAHAGDGAQQAEHYLSLVSPASDDLVAIDVESPHTGAPISYTELCAFVETVKSKLGRYPVVYGSNVLRQITAGHHGAASILNNCPLWIANYGSDHPTLPDPWGFWTLWQYTDGTKCAPGFPKEPVAGIRSPVLRDTFNITEKPISSYWPNI